MPQRDFEELLNDVGGNLTTTGSSNAYAVQTAQSIEGYYAGLWLRLKANHTNTGAATLAVNGASAAAIRKGTTTALAGGEIVSGRYFDVVYDETNSVFQLQNPAPDSFTNTFVVGPASATDNAIARFDGTTGKLLQNSAVTIGDTGSITIDGSSGDPSLTIRGTSGNPNIELGRVDGNASSPFIDFHSGATAVDYDARIIASGGTGSNGGATVNVAAAALQLNSVNLLTAAYSPLTLATEQATTSGTTFDFSSPIAAPKRVTVMLSGVSLNGSGDYLVQIGDSGGLETTGYDSASTGATSTTAYVMRGGSAARVFSGHMVLTHSGNNKWISSHGFADTVGPNLFNGAGNKTLSAALDRLRLTCSAGAFDAGSVNVLWE